MATAPDTEQPSSTVVPDQTVYSPPFHTRTVLSPLRHSRSGSPDTTASPKRHGQPPIQDSGMQLGRSLHNRVSSSSSVSRPSKFRENMILTPVEAQPLKKRRTLRGLRKIFSRKPRRAKHNKSARPSHYCSVPRFDGAEDHTRTDSNVRDSLTLPHAERLRSSVSTTSRHSPGKESIALTFIDNSPSKPPTPAIRTQSLEEYEKSLTIQGDSRRRESTINADAVRAMEADNRNDSVTQKRPLLRASPLYGPPAKSGEQALMEKALQFHQAEKGAFFRFKGKDKASAALSTEQRIAAEEPIFHISFGPASSPSRIFLGLDDVDPLASTEMKRAKSTIPLYTSGGIRRTPTPVPFSANEIAGRPQPSVSTTSPSFNGPVPLGIPPASWARFASHTRAARVGSAGQLDGIKTHDFADDMRCYMPDPDHAIHKRKHGGLMERIGISSRPNDTKIRRVVRYYKNLLGGVGGGSRRTSVATGGKLRDPELEMLSPVLAGRDVAFGEGKEERARGRKRKRTRGGSQEEAGDQQGQNMELAMMSGANEVNKVDECDPGAFIVNTNIQEESKNVFVPTVSALEEPTLPTETTATVPEDPALTLDGAVDAAVTRLQQSSLSPRSSARCLSELYQRECVKLPPPSDYLSHVSEEAFDEVRAAVQVPLPETPLKRGRSMKKSNHVGNNTSRSHASSTAKYGSSPIGPTSISNTAHGGHLQSSAKKLFFLPEVESPKPTTAAPSSQETMHTSDMQVAAAEMIPKVTNIEQTGKVYTRRPDTPVPTSRIIGPTNTVEVSIRQFPSITVVDDRKGEWRSISFISTLPSSRNGSGASSLPHPSSKVRNVSFHSGHDGEEPERAVSGESKYDTVRSRPGPNDGTETELRAKGGEVRGSTMDLLHQVEQRQGKELKRLLGVGERVSSSSSAGIAV
ncbi:Hypothetical protein D9617_12g036710 [Elsinoe fawcettii]|nr:Hypothetical protein D9617_12g036710 [Elsinoe fawcettii]